MSASAGRVLLLGKGEYNSATEYHILDVVSYHGSSYFAKQTTTNHLPTNTTYWQLLVGGEGMASADTIAYAEDGYTSSRAYAIDDYVYVLSADKFYKVTATVSGSGETLTVGTNISETTVGAELSALNNSLASKADASTAATKSDLANISITGSTNTTGSTIKSGTYFYKDGLLVRAKTDIANGATLTSGTNYTVVTVGALNMSEPVDIHTVFTDVSESVSEIKAYKSGRMVMVSFRLLGGLAGNSKLFEIPSGYRPIPINIVVPIYAGNTGKLLNDGAVWLEASYANKITYYGDATSTPCYGSITYIINS